MFVIFATGLPYVVIYIDSRPARYFEYKDVKETLLRLKDYLGDHLHRIVVSVTHGMVYHNCKIDEKTIWGAIGGSLIIDVSQYEIGTIRIEFNTDN